jgi:hypothetical protein
VENAVEKGKAARVSDSARNASTLCTSAGAGTFALKSALFSD